MMNIDHSPEDSWYMKRTHLSPALGEKEQAQAFAAFAEARHALRTHLHGCKEVVSHILSKAKAAVSGGRGFKKEAKRLFHSKGPTAQKLQDCSHPADQETLSTALHALGGKQALYSECAKLAKSVRSHKKVQSPQSEVDSNAAYLKQLKALEAGYIQRQGDLVVGNLRLVAAVIQKLQIQSMPWEDLLQHGAISLQKAVEYFNPSKGNKFSTYAVPVIRGDLLRAMENFSTEVRIPSHVWEKMRNYNKVENDLVFVLGRAPTPGEVALEMGITLQEAVQLQQYQWAPVSLDAPMGSQGEGICLGETLMDHTIQTPGSESSAYQECVAPYAEGLDFVERSVLAKLAGDGALPRMNAEEIALAMGLDEATVSGAIASGLQKVLESRRSAEEAA